MGQYISFRMKPGKKPRPAEDRFWEKVNKTSSCWLWTAFIYKSGYGQFISLSGFHSQLAHRFSYAMAYGPIKKGLQIDHICRVRHCVNPSHLEAVSQRENLLRGVGWAGINSRKTKCPKGHPFSKVNTIVEKNGWRKCRECKNARRRKNHGGIGPGNELKI